MMLRGLGLVLVVVGGVLGLEELEEGFHYDVDSTTVTAGSAHACALEAVDGVEFGGKPVCWGDKRFHRLDVVDDIFIQISAGEFATCGVNLEERVRCWGDHIRDPPATMKFQQVSCGTYHCCGVTDGFGIECWGANFMGQLDSPKKGKFVQVSAGQTHTCALDSKGLLTCWGEDRRRATKPPPFQYLQHSCHTHECCGIRLDGKIVCHGGGLDEERDYQVYGDPDESFTMVSLGEDFMCALREDMTMRCWGKRLILNYMPPPEEEVLLLSAGKKQVCVVLASTTQLVCFGDKQGAPADFEVAL